MHLIFKKVPTALMITVRFYGIAFDNAGIREWRAELIESSKVNDLLWLVAENFPKLCELMFAEGVYRDYLAISINNRDRLGLQGVHTRLEEGDLVFLMPPIGGG
jgi:molybdopterin converting factor small subunit